MHASRPPAKKEDDGRYGLLPACLPARAIRRRSPLAACSLSLSARVGYIGTIHFGRERETEMEIERWAAAGKGMGAVQHTLSNTDIHNTDECPSGRNQTLHTTGRDHRPFSHENRTTGAHFTTFRRNSVCSRLQIPDNPVVVVVDRDFFFLE